MPTFEGSVTFEIETQIEPDGIRFDRYAPEGVEVEDESYFSSQDIRIDGGSIGLKIEAETLEAAERLAQEIISEGAEYEDDNGFTWVASSVYVELEKVEEPMTLVRAQEILTNLVSNSDDEEIGEAVRFVFTYIAELGTRISSLVTQVERLTAGTGAIGRAERFVATGGDTEVLTEGLPEASDGGNEATA